MSLGSTPVRRSQRIASQRTASPSPRIPGRASATPIKSPRRSSLMKTPPSGRSSQKGVNRLGKRSPRLPFGSQYEADDDIPSSHPDVSRLEHGRCTWIYMNVAGQYTPPRDVLCRLGSNNTGLPIVESKVPLTTIAP